MKGDKIINERILKGIKENSQGDEKIVNFLIDILYEEVEHTAQWWWKETYKKIIEQYSKDWGEDGL
ncbi:MAG TPA: hypothetical protein VIK77_07670 [Tissierellaceae bacterium]